MTLFSFKVWLFAFLGAVTLAGFFSRSPIVPLVLYFGWLMVEDLVRKLWGNDMTIYFAKFILMQPIILKTLKAWRKERDLLPRIVRAPLMVWIGVVLLNSFNPNLAHPLESLLGIHSDLFYLVIFLPAGYYLLRSFREVNILFTLLCVFTIFPTIIGTMQQTITPALWNERVLEGTELRPFLDRGIHVLRESYFRVNSVFVDPGRYASYGAMMLLVGVGTGLLFSRSRVYSFVGWSAFGMSAINILLSGVRRTMVTAVATILAFILLSAWTKRGVGRATRLGILLVKRLPLVAGVFALLYAVAAQPIEKGIRYFSSTLFGTETMQSEVSSRLPGYVSQLSLIPKFGLLGRGTGSASLGKQYLQTRLGLSTTPYVSENGFTDKASAYGILGLTVWVWLLGAILIALWDARKNAPDPQRKAFVTLIFSWSAFFFTITQLWGSQIIQDYLNQSFYWLLIGVALSCPQWASHQPLKMVQLRKAVDGNLRWSEGLGQ